MQRRRFFSTPLVAGLLAGASGWPPLTRAAAAVAATDEPAVAPRGVTRRPLVFPADFGAHPDTRIEWWYVTGALNVDGDMNRAPQYGFQLTFFRVRTGIAADHPSRFAAHQLILAHTALSTVASRRLRHDEGAARSGFTIADATTGDTAVWLRRWQLRREGPAAASRYHASVDSAAAGFGLELAFASTGPPLLQGDGGYSRKGPQPAQASHYYSQPQLHTSGRQVVLSSDRPPKAMITLEERLQSRFEWGLMADIQMPDIETRMAILQTKAEQSQLAIPRTVIETIARNVRNNIRELEGALNKVIAYAELIGGAVDDRLVQMALADILHPSERVTVDQIISAVADHYHVTTEALCGSNRSRAIAFPRQMAMYLARVETDASFPQIGGHLGNRDHTTILYGYEKIASIVETDASVRRDVMKIKSALYEGPTA